MQYSLSISNNNNIDCCCHSTRSLLVFVSSRELPPVEIRNKIHKEVIRRRQLEEKDYNTIAFTDSEGQGPCAPPSIVIMNNPATPLKTVAVENAPAKANVRKRKSNDAAAATNDDDDDEIEVVLSHKCRRLGQDDVSMALGSQYMVYLPDSEPVPDRDLPCGALPDHRRLHRHVRG
ncbi:hypothetical protein EsH8_XIV_000021 [Colletotrichum jinshuiense]